MADALPATALSSTLCSCLDRATHSRSMAALLELLRSPDHPSSSGGDKDGGVKATKATDEQILTFIQLCFESERGSLDMLAARIHEMIQNQDDEEEGEKQQDAEVEDEFEELKEQKE